MGGYGALIELVLVFALVLGGGLYELRSVRCDKKAARDPAAVQRIDAEHR